MKKLCSWPSLRPEEIHSNRIPGKSECTSNYFLSKNIKCSYSLFALHCVYINSYLSDLYIALISLCYFQLPRYIISRLFYAVF